MKETFEREEEVQYNDELTEKIKERLGERQRKMNMMQEWEVSKRHVTFPIAFTTIAVAACLAGALFLIPALQPQSPLDELGIVPTELTFRGGTPLETAELNHLIDTKQYEVALRKVRKELRNSDLVLKECLNIGEAVDDEELQYAYQQEHLINSEIRWNYIYLLVRMEDYAEARKQLRIYMKHKEYNEHNEEAKALLAKIKERN